MRLILLREWDPIGVTAFEDYREDTEDEYNSYARALTDMLARKAAFDEILAYLKWAAVENMRLTFEEDKARRTAKLLADGM